MECTKTATSAFVDAAQKTAMKDTLECTLLKQDHSVCFVIARTLAANFIKNNHDLTFLFVNDESDSDCTDFDKLCKK